MHSVIYSEFRRIVSSLRPEGRILEIGAVPNSNSLLAMDELKGAKQRIGINIAPPGSFDGFEVIEGNANSMVMFGDAEFDCVLCNAMLEHDPYFWRTCAEIRRVIRVGGLAIIGVPSYVRYADIDVMRMPRPLAWLLKGRRGLIDATLTFRYHWGPEDYYRFSETACREVLLEGFRDVHLRSIMTPPRTVSHGFKT